MAATKEFAPREEARIVFRSGGTMAAGLPSVDVDPDIKILKRLNCVLSTFLQHPAVEQAKDMVDKLRKNELDAIVDDEAFLHNLLAHSKPDAAHLTKMADCGFLTASLVEAYVRNAPDIGDCLDALPWDAPLSEESLQERRDEVIQHAMQLARTHAPKLLFNTILNWPTAAAKAALDHLEIEYNSSIKDQAKTRQHIFARHRFEFAGAQR